MSLSRNARPTPGNLRTRLYIIRDAAEAAVHMASRWNPKGRYFKVQRDILTECAEMERRARAILSVLERR